MYNYNYGNSDISSFFNNSSDVTTAAAGVIVGVLIGIIVIGLVIGIFMIIANWKIFTKAKQPGWASIIPIYNNYIMCKAVGVNPWWILITILAPILNIIPIIGNLLSLAITIYFVILVNVSLARSFGKEDSYAIGLILLPIVFYPILAFGKSEYQGATPMNDVVFNKAQETFENNRGGIKENTKYCSKCGAPMSMDAKFCPKCGEEVK